MILAHTSDAWVMPRARKAALYAHVTILGGFAAPLFLFLAGLALVLAAERALMRTGNRRAAIGSIVGRGAEIFILAFLFRIQAFVLSPGGWAVTIFRVDILNVMGPAIAVSGLLWGISRTRSTAVLAQSAAAVTLAMLTPVVRVAGWVAWLPTWGQWYLRPSGDNTTFTLFPWAGFVCAGAACGSLIASARNRREERRLMAGFGVAAVVLVAAGFYTATLPSIYRESSFWTSSPTFFAIRIGVMLGALVLLFGLQQGRTMTGAMRWLADAVERFGRNSLFVYWIHVELVYGYTTWLIRHRLPLWGFAVAYLIFVAAMYKAIDVRDWAVTTWRMSKFGKKPTPVAVA